MNNAELRAIARHAMLQRGLQPDFNAAAQQQLDTIDHAATEQGPAIRDLRELPWCSIDNDDSRDLDQLSVSLPVRGGSPGDVRILVAIADVDGLLAVDSPIDQRARHNTTSVYTAAGVFPMLPEKLSTDLTSLNEGVERLAIVVDMVVGANGVVAPIDGVSGSSVYRARVLNRAQLAYNAVAAWLDADSAAPAKVAALPGLDEQLRLQDRVAQAMKRERHARGALSLATNETRPVFSDGVLTDLRPDFGNRAKELIANLMIAANGVTARYLEKHRLPSLRRMLRVPARWDRIAALAAQVGETLPEAANAAALDAFLAKRRAADPARFADLSLSIVKLLGSGEYAVDVPGHPIEGHFGLAVKDYQHSTAPNRRFPDLITQRLLKAALSGQAPPYSIDELRGLAAHCTEQEDDAAKIERQVAKSAAALLLAPRIGAQFDGVVTGASDKGVYVRIASPTAEGRVVRRFDGFDVGDRVRVKLLHTDAARGFIDFEGVHAS